MKEEGVKGVIKGRARKVKSLSLSQITEQRPTAPGLESETSETLAAKVLISCVIRETIDHTEKL